MKKDTEFKQRFPPSLFLLFFLAYFSFGRYPFPLQERFSSAGEFPGANRFVSDGRDGLFSVPASFSVLFDGFLLVRYIFTS